MTRKELEEMGASEEDIEETLKENRQEAYGMIEEFLSNEGLVDHSSELENAMVEVLDLDNLYNAGFGEREKMIKKAFQTVLMNNTLNDLDVSIEEM